MSIISRAVRIVNAQKALIRSKNAEIAEKNATIEILQRCVLEHERAYVDLVIAWRISIERPEEDIRDELDAMIAELRDNVAQAEEFVA